MRILAGTPNPERNVLAEMEQRCIEVAQILGVNDATAVVRAFGEAVVSRNAEPWNFYAPSEIAQWWSLRGSKR